jgi:hypothetical protein
MKFSWIVAGLLVFPAVTPAQKISADDEPYDLQIVVRHGAHTWLGRPFRDEFRRNLLAMLTDAFGPMAQIRIVDMREVPKDQWPALWRDIDRRGLKALDSATPTETGKRHFVTIDFLDGQYEVAARQWDGDTDWLSQLVVARTSDRALVSRLAGKLIAETFGIVGTLLGKGAPSGIGEVRASLRLRGGSLTPFLDRWVRPGDVFAVSIVTNVRGEQPNRKVVQRDILVRVVEPTTNGVAPVRVVYRSSDNPLARLTASQSVRCIRMGASHGPVRLRLVDDRGQPHTRTLQIRLHSQAFQEGLSPDEEVVNPDRGGLFISRKSYDQLAFARVITGGAQIARLPVPIFPDREVIAVVAIDAAQEQFGQLQAMKSELLRNYKEAVLVQIDAYNEITKLVKETKNADALKRANSARLALERELEQLQVRKQEVRKLLEGTKITLTDCDEVEKDLENHKVRMNRLIGRLIETERLENAPDKVEKKLRLQQQHNKVQVLIDSDDYDGALALLKQLTEEYPEETNIKKQFEELDRQWAIKGDAHREAREFVYQVWAASKTPADIEKNLPLVRQRLNLLAQVGDRLTMLKLRNSLPSLGKILADEARNFANTEEDEEKRAKFKKLVEDFDRLSQEVDTAIRGGNS